MSVPQSIIFELPLNERIRTLLRLEFLLLRADNALSDTTEIQHRNALDAILNMLSVFERSDIKQELMKEIERLSTNLSALEHAPGVDKNTLESLLAQLDQSLDALHVQKSGIGQVLKENDFLYSIRQRSTIPGGTCDFDLPAYHYWLQHSAPEQRSAQLKKWLTEFDAVRDAVVIILQLIRGSVGFTSEIATDGFYQRSLDTSLPFQLIRVELPADVTYFPEISGGKHRFTVRFMDFSLSQRPQQVHSEISFKLSCCSM